MPTAALDLPIQIGSLMVSHDMLQTMVDQMVPKLPEGRKVGIGFGLDNEGAKIAAVFQQGPDSKWRIQAAFQHDWTGDTRVGVGGQITF